MSSFLSYDFGVRVTRRPDRYKNFFRIIGHIHRIPFHFVLVLQNTDITKKIMHFVFHVKHISGHNGKDKYYLALRESQAKLKSPNHFSWIWVEFFLELLKKQEEDLKAKIERERKAHQLPDLSEKICSLAYDHSRITVAFIANEIQANRNTVKKHLQNLVKLGRLVKHGKGRGAYYSPF